MLYNRALFVKEFGLILSGLVSQQVPVVLSSLLLSCTNFGLKDFIAVYENTIS